MANKKGKWRVQIGHDYACPTWVEVDDYELKDGVATFRDINTGRLYVIGCKEAVLVFHPQTTL
jgi:hypothetical protein